MLSFSVKIALPSSISSDYIGTPTQESGVSPINAYPWGEIIFELAMITTSMSKSNFP